MEKRKKKEGQKKKVKNPHNSGGPIDSTDISTPLNPSCAVPARRRRSLRPPPPHPRIRITHATPAMATSSDGGGGDQRRLLSIPKEGERIIAPTRRPDGTLRKAIRIRAGYVPQEEVAIYQSKGALVSHRLLLPPSFLPRITTSPSAASLFGFIFLIGLARHR